MDAATVLWVALAVVLLAGAGLLAAPGARRRPRPAGPRAAGPTGPPRPRFPDDDLPGFRAAPPGTPAAAVPAARPAPVRLAPAEPAGGPSVRRVLTATAAAALALVAVLAVLAGVDRDTRPGSTASGPDASGDSTSGTAPASWPVPPLPPVPGSPAAGEAGAGGLATLSVPLDAGGWAARLAFAPLVLEPRAVGAVVAGPAVSVTRRSDGTALAHLRLPAWNCLAAAAPADPAAAGCTPLPVEYADLPSPALGTAVTDGTLRLTGRFPTYTRPRGGPPVYTGRVYELTVTVAASGPVRGGDEAPARGTLVLGTDRAESLPDPRLSAVRRGG
ncbi:hypothetical protein [Blastococcus sp. SYSU D00695]